MRNSGVEVTDMLELSGSVGGTIFNPMIKSSFWLWGQPKVTLDHEKGESAGGRGTGRRDDHTSSGSNSEEFLTTRRARLAPSPPGPPFFQDLFSESATDTPPPARHVDVTVRR
jgi:hypothetical protein